MTTLELSQHNLVPGDIGTTSSQVLFTYRMFVKHTSFKET